MAVRVFTTYHPLVMPSLRTMRQRRGKLAILAALAASSVAAVVLAVAIIAVLLGTAAGYLSLPWPGGRSAEATPQPASTGDASAQGAPWPAPVPIIRSAELLYLTAPQPGVWAELKVVLENPLAATPESPTKTTLLVSGTLLEDYRIRGAEPKLAAPPRRRPDGRYALVFAAPIPESLNWYRVFLTARTSTVRPLQVAYLLDGSRKLPDLSPVQAQVLFKDQQEDPFLAVPEPLVRWVPGQAAAAFPVLLTFALVIGLAGATGCVVAFRASRRLTT